VPARHIELGRSGEDAAAGFLASKGWRVLARNWRQGGLELDIVCEEPGVPPTLVFVEVKTRGPGSLGSPSDGLGPAKQKRLARGASLYLSAAGNWSQPCRFDLVSVWKTEAGYELEHVEDAFRPAAVGGGDADWQPW